MTLNTIVIMHKINNKNTRTPIHPFVHLSTTNITYTWNISISFLLITKQYCSRGNIKCRFILPALSHSFPPSSLLFLPVPPHRIYYNNEKNIILPQLFLFRHFQSNPSHHVWTLSNILQINSTQFYPNCFISFTSFLFIFYPVLFSSTHSFVRSFSSFAFFFLLLNPFIVQIT